MQHETTVRPGEAPNHAGRLIELVMDQHQIADSHRLGSSIDIVRCKITCSGAHGARLDENMLGLNCGQAAHRPRAKRSLRRDNAMRGVVRDRGVGRCKKAVPETVQVGPTEK